MSTDVLDRIDEIVTPGCDGAAAEKPSAEDGDVPQGDYVIPPRPAPET